MKTRGTGKGMQRLIAKRAAVVMPLHPELKSDSNPGKVLPGSKPLRSKGQK